jgi:phosphatidate cytidylyltransferase
VALFGVPLLIIIIWFGGLWEWVALVAVAGIAGIIEFFNMVGRRWRRPPVLLGVVWTALFILAPISPWELADTTLLVGTAGLVSSLLWLLTRSHKEGALTAWAWTLAGVLYIGWLLSHLVALRGLDEPEIGRAWVLLTLLVTFATDSSAYFIGRTWGRHSLAPRISPAKTWEGATGGVIGSAVACFVLVYLLQQVGIRLPLNPWQTLLLGVIIGVFAQVGDLTESFFKRTMDAKDSGSLLPGHGGVLDRADSIMFAGVVVYFYVILL